MGVSGTRMGSEVAVKVETLEEFLAVAKCRSFSQAARALYLSQSTVSSHIALMEKELGFEVIDRSRQPLMLTPAGAVFAEYAQTTVDAYRAGCAHARAVMRELPPLRIAGVSLGSNEFRLLSRIEEPSFVFVGSDGDAPFFAALLSGAADIEISAAPYSASRLDELDGCHRYAVLPAGHGFGAVAMSRSNPLAELERLSFADIDGATVTIGSCSAFDVWKSVVESMVAGRAHLNYRLKPLNSSAEIARDDLGDTLHICGLESTTAYYAQRDDIAIFTQVDGKALTYPLCIGYRTDTDDERIERLAVEVSDALVAACNA